MSFGLQINHEVGKYFGEAWARHMTTEEEIKNNNNKKNKNKKANGALYWTVVLVFLA